ncbi:twin-arginine translocation signal domain-containing protein [Streptomyces californicus]
MSKRGSGGRRVGPAGRRDALGRATAGTGTAGPSASPPPPTGCARSSV